jgi:hypothetical protein
VFPCADSFVIYRWLAIVSVAAYLAGQVAVSPHDHPATPSGHNAQRHIHLQTRATHTHAHGGHSHSHGSDSVSFPDDHDEGCVHLPDDSAVAQAKVQLPELAAVSLLSCDVAGLACVDASRGTARRTVAPEIERSGCDFCLTLRALLI